jgi:4-hydroxy-tetrahydrodipicolinate synthase
VLFRSEAAIDWGVTGITAMGVMAEPGSLTAPERSAALERITDAARGRVPVVVGCSAASEHLVLQHAAEARARGAAGIMVAAPTLLRNVDALPDFFGRVARGAGLPVVVQDEPAATGVLVPVSVLLRCLEAAASRIVKLEEAPTPPKITRLLEARPDLRVFGGLGGVSSLSELSRGACGTMTGFAYPEVLGAIRRAVEAADLPRAGEIYDKYLPLIQFEGQIGVGLAIRKEVLRRRGVLSCAVTRGTPRIVDALTSGELDDVLRRVGIVPGRAALAV